MSCPLARRSRIMRFTISLSSRTARLTRIMAGTGTWRMMGGRIIRPPEVWRIRDVQRCRHPFRVCFHFHPEKDLGDDAHGELHHFLMDVADFAVLPGGQHFFGEGGHRIAVRRHALAMEGGLAQAALPQPSRAFVGQQALAQEPAAVLDDFIFGEILRLRDQDRLDEAGMIEEIDIHPGGAVVKDVAKFAGPAGVDRQRIGIE